MIINKILPEVEMKKIYRKLEVVENGFNGVVLVLLASNWVETDDGKYTNTIPFENFTSETSAEVDLYDDGKLTELQYTVYDEYIDHFEINDGELVATANTLPTQTISVVVKGLFPVDEVTVGNLSQIMSKLDEANNKVETSLGGLSFGKDGDGNYGYYGADGSLIPFKQYDINNLIDATITGANAGTVTRTITVPADKDAVAFIHAYCAYERITITLNGTAIDPATTFSSVLKNTTTDKIGILPLKANDTIVVTCQGYSSYSSSFICIGLFAK